MTEAEWLACRGPERMLELLVGKYSDRKWRLYACGCCRVAWHLLTEEESRRAVEVAERFAEGGETRQALAEAHRQALGAARQAAEYEGRSAVYAAVAASHDWGGSSGCLEAIRAARALQSRGYD